MYIDNVKFAKSNQTISQTIDVMTLSRVQEIDNYQGKLDFKLSGYIDSRNRPVLNLAVYGIIDTLCQNCLEGISLTIDNVSDITIFFSEKTLEAALFSDSEIDVADGVLFDEEFDVIGLVEDEVIMLLPVAPKHESCVGLNYHDQTENAFSILKKNI